MRHAGVHVGLHLDVVGRQPRREACRFVAEEVKAPDAQVGWRKTTQIGSPGGGSRIGDSGYYLISEWFARAVNRVYRALPESPSSALALSVLFPK